MKTRNGFVSNSSSSSFVLITDIDSHNKVLETMKGEQFEEWTWNNKGGTMLDGEKLAQIVDQQVGRKKIGGTELVILAVGSGEMWESEKNIETWVGLDNSPRLPSPPCIADLDKGIGVDDEEFCNLSGEAERAYRKTATGLGIPTLTQNLAM